MYSHQEVKVAHIGPRISQPYLFAIVAVLIVLPMLISSVIEERRIDKQREFCARYGAIYNGAGCIIRPT